ncbi:MAG: CreA family protein [Bdellovibrionales bacterium]|nr:CreA family protein [Bdellovibrionales bacterium]
MGISRSSCIWSNLFCFNRGSNWSDFSSDPSDSSIACRQTGPISESDLRKIEKSSEGEDIFSVDKGGFNKKFFNLFKELNVRRIYDRKNNTLLYVTTRLSSSKDI